MGFRIYGFAYRQRAAAANIHTRHCESHREKLHWSRERALRSSGRCRSAIGEALGLELQHIPDDFRTIYVRQSVWEGMKQDPKTQAAIRDVDVCSALAEMLRQFIGERRTGFLFVNRSGRALAQSNVLRRSLHPLLKELKTEKAGFHSFRRFRTTHLRKNRVPEDLLRFWIGHADKTITETYCKVQ